MRSVCLTMYVLNLFCFRQAHCTHTSYRNIILILHHTVQTSPTINATSHQKLKQWNQTNQPKIPRCQTLFCINFIIAQLVKYLLFEIIREMWKQERCIIFQEIHFVLVQIPSLMSFNKFLGVKSLCNSVKRYNFW